MLMPVTKCNTDLQNAHLYGGLFVGLIGAIMVIVSNPFTQPVAKVLEHQSSVQTVETNTKKANHKTFVENAAVSYKSHYILYETRKTNHRTNPHRHRPVFAL